MPDDTPLPHWAEKPDGLPWQVVYSAFLGVLLAMIGVYAGFYLVKRAGDYAAAAGIGLIALSAGMGVSFVALLAGARWALSVCRITTMASIAIALACIGNACLYAPAPPKFGVPGTRRWLDMLFEPGVLIPLAGLAACAFLLCLLLGPTVRKHFART